MRRTSMLPDRPQGIQERIDQRTPSGDVEAIWIAIDARLADYSPGGTAQYGLTLARALAEQRSPHRITVLRAARPQVDSEQVDSLPERRLLTPPHHRWEQI